MVKRVVIAAAGQGTRMLNLTKNKPKHLIEVNGKPFLSYVLDNLKEAGYEDITIIVGYKGELTKSFLDENGYKVKVINQFEILGDPKGAPEKMYGTACPLMCIKDINESFIYLSGDNFYSVQDLKNINIDDEYNYISGVEVDNSEGFGVLLRDGEFLKEIIEKPKNSIEKLINATLYKFTPEIFEKVSKIDKSPRGEYEITDAVSLLAKEKKVKINIIKGFWMDFGKPDDITKFSKFLDESN